MKHFSTFQDKRSAKEIRGEFRSFNLLFVTWLAFWILLDINLSMLSSSYKIKWSFHFCKCWVNNIEISKCIGYPLSGKGHIGLNVCMPMFVNPRYLPDHCLPSCWPVTSPMSHVIPWYESLCVMSDGKLPCGAAIMSQITHITISDHWPIRGQERRHQQIRTSGRLGRLKPFLPTKEFKVGSWVA